MYETIELRVQVPIPTTEQITTWLTANGWCPHPQSTHSSPEGLYFTNTSLDAGLVLDLPGFEYEYEYNCRIADCIEYVAASHQISPMDLYQKIMGNNPSTT